MRRANDATNGETHAAYSAKTLLSHSYVKKTKIGKKEIVSLTAEGMECAQKCDELEKAEERRKNNNAASVAVPVASSVSANSIRVAVDWKCEVCEVRNADSAQLCGMCHAERPGSVVLFADAKESNVFAYFSPQFKWEVKGNLAIGDYVWVFRQPGREDEVLNLITERKTFDDLRESKRDGRYENQKERLIRLGLRRMYILEQDYTSCDFRVEEAKLEVLLQGFILLESEGPKDTARKLEHMTALLSRNRAAFQSQILMSDLRCFRKTVNPTVAQSFAALLFQVPCQRLLSEKVECVTRAFPSVASLLAAYEERGNVERLCVALIANMQTLRAGRKSVPSLQRPCLTCSPNKLHFWTHTRASCFFAPVSCSLLFAACGGCGRSLRATWPGHTGSHVCEDELAWSGGFSVNRVADLVDCEVGP